MKDTRYDSLKAELEDIKLITDTQMHHHKLGQEYLCRGRYKGLLVAGKNNKVERVEGSGLVFCSRESHSINPLAKSQYLTLAGFLRRLSPAGRLYVR